MRLLRSRLPTLGFALVVASSSALPEEAKLPPVREFAQRVNEVGSQLRTAEDNLKLVEAEYSQRELTNEEALARRFSSGEIQYLLRDYSTASVLFYDLVSDKEFQQNPRLADALFYLGDSLYNQQNLTSAKLYFRQLLALGGSRAGEALERFVEISGQLNEFSGIDEYVSQVRSHNGSLPPEVSYVYAKSMLRRSDLPLPDRISASEASLRPLWDSPSAPMRLQSGYLLALGYLQLGQTDRAIEQFRRITTQRPRDARETKVKELASLSLGRLLYEVEKFDEAIDSYQEVPRDSEYYVDSLYEIAWCQVRKGDFQRAKNATEILELVAQGSTVEPDAKILHAHLLLKLRQYEQAEETYNAIINTYSPVRDEVSALLSANKEPVTYFDKLIARSQRGFEAASLLPRIAVKWATTGREVSEALRILSDLDLGRKNVGDAEDIAQGLLKVLNEQRLEIFPTFQEGYARAEAVDSALTQADQNLIRIEEQLLSNELSPEVRKQLQDFRQEKAQLERQFSMLPTTPGEVQARRKRLRDRVDLADRSAFKLGYELQSMFAVVAAAEKWVGDTKSQRKSAAEEENAFVEKLRQESKTLDGLEKELLDLRKVLARERAAADRSLSGEDVIRDRYADLLQREHSLLEAAESRIPAVYRAVLDLVHGLRGHANELKLRAVQAKRVVQQRVAEHGDRIREKVRDELALLSTYQNDVNGVSSEARNLVGRIAFDSFKRVHQQFHDLVLKADVGVVDIAFTRKQDDTSEIQKLASQKDKELRGLDEEFKDVLKEDN